VVDDAVKDAYYNAKINGLEERAEFYSGKAEDLLKQ
jgi:tRNA/tmRNA/rRNA uracil-C5-methylase (TrmA/RlmC/RlmD family)